MDNSTNLDEQLIRYLDGELAGPEKQGFEEALAADPELQSRLESLRLSREAIRSYGLKQHVARIHDEMMKGRAEPTGRIGANRRIIRFAIAIAASVLLVVLAARLFVREGRSAEQLFADNFRTYELSTVRGTENEDAVEKAYRSKDFKTVIAMTDSSRTIRNLFLSGMAFLEQKQPKPAIDRFKKVLQQDEARGSTDFMDEAEYNMALAFLLDKQYSFALGLMQKIKDNPMHTYREKITDRLIRDIKKLN
jgi:hypothetical protein